MVKHEKLGGCQALIEAYKKFEMERDDMKKVRLKVAGKNRITKIDSLSVVKMQTGYKFMGELNQEIAEIGFSNDVTSLTNYESVFLNE